MDANAEIRQLLKTPEVPEIDSRVRPNVQSIGALTAHVRSIVRPGVETDLICGTLLLWHDHLEAAHEIAQRFETADGSYLHAIMHRREPDYGNAKYWFRRVGNHPCFPALARKASEAYAASALVSRIINKGEWDPFAFVDACEQLADKSANHAGVQTLRHIQAIELELFLDHLLRAEAE